VPENRSGAAGAIASGFVAGAPPDGHTILLDSGGHAVNPFLMRGLGFDYATAFAPITLLATLPLVLVTHDRVSLRQLLARDRLTYGSVGVGSRTHLAGALLLRRAGAAGTHIPYRGGAEQITAQLRGETDFGFSSIALTTALLREGRLQALGTSAPGPVLPDVPPLAEAWPGFSMFDWLALHAPARTPAAVVARLAEAARAAMATPMLQPRLAELGLRPDPQGPAALSTFLAGERAVMSGLIAAEGIRLD
jgi:tripartite-type tricarboxylate transporter receptor subunit TctC